MNEMKDKYYRVFVMQRCFCSWVEVWINFCSDKPLLKQTKLNLKKDAVNYLDVVLNFFKVKCSEKSQHNDLLFSRIKKSEANYLNEWQYSILYFKSRKEKKGFVKDLMCKT